MINDGYTESLTVDGTQYTYRPMLHEERLDLYRRIAKYGAACVPSAIRELVTDRVKGLTDDEPDETVFAIWEAITKGRSDELEAAESQNLVDGVWIELTAPQVARRSCDECRKWWYDHDTGKVVEKGGKKLKRVPGSSLPCEAGVGCAKGHWHAPKSLSAKNHKAYEHYLGCRSLGAFPQDSIVARNARLISEVERRAERFQIRKIVREELKRHANGC